jgi:MFS family permease
MCTAETRSRRIEWGWSRPTSGLSIPPCLLFDLSATSQRIVHALIGHLQLRLSLLSSARHGISGFCRVCTIYWVPTFFMRDHHWTAAEAGKAYGIVTAIAGCLGIVSGGWLADRLAMRGYADAYLRVGMVAAVAMVPLGSVYLLVSDSHLAVFLLALSVFLNSVPYGIAPAALMQVTPSKMRGQVSAVYLFTVTLIGLGGGPTAVALLTDRLFHNDNMLDHRFSRWALPRTSFPP